MAGLTYGAPDYESAAYTYKNKMPVFREEGDEKWVRITLTADQLNTTFLGSADKTVGLLSGIDGSLIPVEVQIEMTELDSATGLNMDFVAILNDGSNTERGLKEAFNVDGAAYDSSWGLDARGAANFETDHSTLDEIRESLGGNTYDLMLATDIAAGTGTAGTAEISICFVRDGRDLSDVKNSDIAGGQA